jgi:hypothetical protein
MDEMRRAQLEDVLRHSRETRERCTVTSLKAVGVQRVLDGFVPQTWLDVKQCLDVTTGGPGFRELDVNPVAHGEEDHQFRYTPVEGRARTVMFKTFVKRHPTGLYVFGNYRHCVALVDGFLIDTEKGSLGMVPGLGGERHVKQAFELWTDEDRAQFAAHPVVVSPVVQVNERSES